MAKKTKQQHVSRVTRLYPIDPWQGEPLPDAYDLLIYAKNGYLGEPSRISQFGFSAHKVIVDFGHLLSAQVEKHELAPYSLRKVGPGVDPRFRWSDFGCKACAYKHFLGSLRGVGEAAKALKLQTTSHTYDGRNRCRFAKVKTLHKKSVLVQDSVAEPGLCNRKPHFGEVNSHEPHARSNTSQSDPAS